MSQIQKQRQSGFTLIELTVVIAVFAIMATVAIPSFMSLLPGMRLNSSARDILVIMNLTRMRAVARNTVGIVQFNPANNTFTAWLDDGPAGNNWALDSTDTRIKSGATETGVSITGTTIPYHTFGYNGRGLPAGTPGVYAVTLTNSEGKTQNVQISSIGSVKLP